MKPKLKRKNKNTVELKPCLVCQSPLQNQNGHQEAGSVTTTGSELRKTLTSIGACKKLISEKEGEDSVKQFLKLICNGNGDSFPGEVGVRKNGDHPSAVPGSLCQKCGWLIDSALKTRLSSLEVEERVRKLQLELLGELKELQLLLDLFSVRMKKVLTAISPQAKSSTNLVEVVKESKLQ